MGGETVVWIHCKSSDNRCPRRCNNENLKFKKKQAIVMMTRQYG